MDTDALTSFMSSLDQSFSTDRASTDEATITKYAIFLDASGPDTHERIAVSSSSSFFRSIHEAYGAALEAMREKLDSSQRVVLGVRGVERVESSLVSRSTVSIYDVSSLTPISSRWLLPDELSELLREPR
jgi:hypothetical protein